MDRITASWLLGRATLTIWKLMINIQKVRVSNPYIFLYAIKIDIIAAHFFSKLKSTICFNDFTSFCQYTQFILDCFNKAITSNCYTFGPLRLPAIITINQ
jgi:hypothetical protein